MDQGSLAMTALAFIIGVSCLFFVLLAFETTVDSTQPRLRQSGLFTWLVSGNWPAKVGAGLLIIGIGALIRYFLLTVQLPPEIKIGSGIAAAALLGAVSFHLRERPERRALHLALAGTSLGVAYLTAYSAYGFFGYVNSTTALALLILVVAASGVFAVNSRAVSVAVLAMLGAFISPAFTIGDPGPAVVYSYYLGASAFTFVLVYLRGWRALIHLSFLFTLAGSVFFGWTREFYHPQYFATMSPLLLALVAVHLGMPLAERHAVRHVWIKRFDTGYAIALPIVAGVLMLLIAPDRRSDGAAGFVMLAALWAVTAGVIYRYRLEGALHHALTACLLLLGAGLLYLEGVPWSLLGLVAATLLFVLAPRLGWSRESEFRLSGVVLLLAVIHIQQALLYPTAGEPFTNLHFVQRLVGVAALIVAGTVGRRRDLPLGDVLAVVAGVWGALVTVIEIARLQLEILPQLVHAAVIALVVALAMLPPRKRLDIGWMVGLAALSVVTAWWAAPDAPEEMAWALLILAPLALFVMALRSNRAGDSDDPVAAVFALAMPLVLAPWAWELGRVMVWDAAFFAMTLTVVAVLAVAYLGKSCQWRAPLWNGALWAYFWVIVLVTTWLLLFRIERGLWPVLFELFSAATLVGVTWSLAGDRRDVAGAATVAISAFVLQAMLLRWFGPPGILSVADLSRMALPAMASLMWATLGGGMCWWSSRIASRGLWVLGSTLLVLSAIKLVLFDFGSLGQLANIIAVLLAGLVFLAVAWVAPIPPKARKDTNAETRVRPAAAAGRDTIARTEAAQSRVDQPPLDGAHDKADKAAPTAAHHADDTAPPAAGRAGNRARYEPEIPAHWLIQDAPSRRGPILAMLGLLAILAWSWNHFLGARNVAAVSASSPAPAVPAPADEPMTPAPFAEAPAPQTEIAAPPVQAPPHVVDACSQFLGGLPTDYVILAGGEYAGRKLGFQVDQTGHEATGFDVVASMPGRSVVLVLGAYEPSIWKISREPRTRIAGVFVTGYHRQIVAGLSADTPVLNSSYDEKGPCGYSYFSRNEAEKMDAHVRQVFGRSAQTYFVASNGQLVMGDGGMPASTVLDGPADFNRFRDVSAPLAGQAGLEQLLADGVLRRAQPSDLLGWKEAQRRSQGLPQLSVAGGQSGALLSPPFRTYVVQRQMTFPSGLYGAHAATFIVLRGVPAPRGNQGHSAVYDWNTLTCDGPLCR
jgi:uncharacterized membrane protein